RRIADAVPLPDDHEIARRADGGGGLVLIVEGRAADAEFHAARVAGCVELLRVNPLAAPVLVVARPGDGERSVRAHRDGRDVLAVGGRSVDEEFAALRRAARV